MVLASWLMAYTLHTIRGEQGKRVDGIHTAHAGSETRQGRTRHSRGHTSVRSKAVAQDNDIAQCATPQSGQKRPARDISIDATHPRSPHAVGGTNKTHDGSGQTAHAARNRPTPLCLDKHGQHHLADARHPNPRAERREEERREEESRSSFMTQCNAG